MVEFPNSSKLHSGKLAQCYYRAGVYYVVLSDLQTGRELKFQTFARKGHAINCYKRLLPDAESRQVTYGGMIYSCVDDLPTRYTGKGCFYDTDEGGKYRKLIRPDGDGAVLIVVQLPEKELSRRTWQTWEGAWTAFQRLNVEMEIKAQAADSWRYKKS